jgi:hypothetical protein
MIRTTNSIVFRNCKTSIIYSIERQIRGGVARETAVPPAAIPSSIKDEHGATKLINRRDIAEPGQRLASFYGHPRLAPLDIVDEESGQESVETKPKFDEIVEDAGGEGKIFESF